MYDVIGLHQIEFKQSNPYLLACFSPADPLRAAQVFIIKTAFASTKKTVFKEHFEPLNPTTPRGWHFTRACRFSLPTTP